jgi:HSP20 family molecular chaperone IbpA
MADTDSREIQVKEKQEVASPAEQTKPGLVFTPDVDIYETESELTLLADVPGVTTDGLSIDLRDNTLTIVGEVAPVNAKGQEALAVEYETGKFYRQFTLSEVIDQDQIDANLTDGVLRLRLPKVEKATPRKIAIQVG